MRYSGGALGARTGLCPGHGRWVVRSVCAIAGLMAALLASQRPALAAEAAGTRHELQLARLVYDNDGMDGWPRWQADWPHAERHFSQGLKRLTRIDVAAEGTLVRIDDDALFDHPWLYAVEVGSMVLGEDDAARLREYLERGGFLVVDDFHGAREWQQFEESIRRVFPDRPIVDLGDDAEAFHVLYSLGEREQIPGIRALMKNRTWEKGGRIARWRGIHDDAGRLMVAINFNQDLGDAWEHADDAAYPQPYTAQAYRMGVNYVVYALTH